MSNLVVGNPWRCDTPGVLTSDKVRVLGLRWVGATTAGHKCVLTDGAGTQTIWDSVAAGSNYVESDMLSTPRLFGGLTLDTLDSGVLYVEVG